VASLCPAGENPLWGLLHDASEAYLSDINSPVKHRPEMQVYRDAEEKLMHVIAAKFNLSWPQPDWVKLADNTALSTEARDLMNDTMEEWNWTPPPPLEQTILPLSQDFAKNLFMVKYYNITRKVP
jgi:hypothetical protein